ncbi:cellulose synthase 1 operon protein C [Striga asiatica]|uniref:Cellulose synthase 1 operon protein C n=1 Tax=Striga asiatica TaxID=4170 RepID=A0A5A7QQ39_STRAF|nr:cellulose synthase 1 operon protein C [Striga asiatica]
MVKSGQEREILSKDNRLNGSEARTKNHLLLLSPLLLRTGRRTCAGDRENKVRCKFRRVVIKKVGKEEPTRSRLLILRRVLKRTLPPEYRHDLEQLLLLFAVVDFSAVRLRAKQLHAYDVLEPAALVQSNQRMIPSLE